MRYGLPYSYNNEGIWNWTGHDGDWIYQGGPNSSAVKNNVTFNQWGPEGDALDDSPVSYHITEVCAMLWLGTQFVMSSEKKRWKRKQAGIMMAVVCCATGRIMHDVHIPGALRILPSGALLTLLAVGAQPVDPLVVDGWLSSVGGGLY